MQRRVRGRALIFNNLYFTSNEVRIGSQQDRDDLEMLFKELNFDTICYNEQTAEVS